jgi:hypothetical protein
MLCGALIVTTLSNTADIDSARKWLVLSTVAVVSLPLLHVHGLADFSTISRQSYFTINAAILGSIALGRWVRFAIRRSDARSLERTRFR